MGFVPCGTNSCPAGLKTLGAAIDGIAVLDSDPIDPTELLD